MTTFEIHVYDEFSPEDTAMMQALYSRSSESVVTHVEKVKKSGSGKFMERFYVGYGHKSIADCGSCTIFIEGVSMLAAKAIQDWPLYSGQETSSRYINMSLQRIEDPLGNAVSEHIYNQWMDFYNTSMEEVVEHLKTRYPKAEGEKGSVYKRAVNAWAFDILRGFLPAGITTQLSWHTNLRQAWDKLFWLQDHPLEEVRGIASTILGELQSKYAHSFGFEVREPQMEYKKEAMKNHCYFKATAPEDLVNFKTSISNEELEQYEELITKRPKYTPLPQFMRELGQVSFEVLLDFGSFRDLQRHRNGVCRMPLLTTEHGFNEWYIKELPQHLQEKATTLIAKQSEAINALPISDEDRQYFIAMGFNTVCRVTYPINAAVYTIELRSGKTVHPTLRKVAHKMHHHMVSAFPKLHLHSDLDPSDRDVRRGKQDIMEKKEVQKTL